ncbi:hypothetical protein [Thalassotalea aquiviva]|uniref:hypothetical protein n=1 Tax=Thalassotalea aquiviva TaxID=3242415 RepID=UPI00352A34A3
MDITRHTHLISKLITDNLTLGEINELNQLNQELDHELEPLRPFDVYSGMEGDNIS